MTTAKHTQWRLHLVDDCTIIDDNDDEVAVVSGDYTDFTMRPEMEARARLIAAAPDLLVELTRLLPLASIHRSRQDCDRIRAVIAKAEG